MWTQLENWIVQDGELPELAVGETLAAHGVRGWVERMTPAGPSRLFPADDPQADGVPVSPLIGPVTWSTEQAVTNGLDDSFYFQSVLRCEGFDVVLATARPLSLGASVDVLATPAIMADYEFDGFGLPDIRRDWTVRGLQLVHRTIDRRSDGVGTAGAVRSIDAIERMHAWTDDPGDVIASYLIDLDPLPTGRS